MKMIRVDLSKVKSNMYDDVKSRSFTESRILEQNDIYEVEIEIDSENSLFTPEQVPLISKHLKSTIKYVQCGFLSLNR